VQAFGSGGIPALITHTILDDFQIDTNNFLAQLWPGLQAQFSVIKDRVDGDKDDTLDITYVLNGNELEYAQLSGAQKLIASLSLKLGLASVNKKRLGTDIKLLLIDEVDQSLDDDMLEAFEEAIKKLQKDFKILVITHNKELKEKFSHAILVEQDENLVSSAKLVNTW
jgi:DNA repair exonuclease SbcCD ATPase subunit